MSLSPQNSCTTTARVESKCTRTRSWPSITQAGCRRPSRYMGNSFRSVTYSQERTLTSTDSTTSSPARVFRCRRPVLVHFPCPTLSYASPIYPRSSLPGHVHLPDYLCTSLVHVVCFAP